jgi:hypothetical protein
VTSFFFYVGTHQYVCNQIAGPSTGQSTIEKRNRKKRAAKPKAEDMQMPKPLFYPEIDAFYSLFMRRKKYKPENS